MVNGLQDLRIAVVLGTLFGRVSEALRRDLGLAAGDGGQHIGSEPFGRALAGKGCLTSPLDAMRSHTLAQARRLGNKLAGGLNLRVEMFPSEGALPCGDDDDGADLGIRVQIVSPRFNLTKAALFRCQAMQGAPDAPTYAGLSARDAEQLLRVSPAAFYLLVNRGEQPRLYDLAGVPVSTVCPVGPWPIPIEEAERIGSQCPIWADTGGTLWDLGLAVLPAARVFGLRRGGEANDAIPVDAAEVLRGCLPFGAFLVDLMGSCFVGDPRASVVQLVTPSARPGGPPPIDDAPVPRPAPFPVRLLLDIRVTSRDA